MQDLALSNIHLAAKRLGLDLWFIDKLEYSV